MLYQNILFTQTTSGSTSMNPFAPIENNEEDFNNLDELPDKEEEKEGPTDHLFDILSQIQFTETDGLGKMDTKKIYKMIKQLKRKLEKEIKKSFLKEKTLKVTKSFCNMRVKDFYDKYILKNLSVKKTFAGFSKSNRRIFRKLSEKVISPKFKLLMSNKISTFFKLDTNRQDQ